MNVGITRTLHRIPAPGESGHAHVRTLGSTSRSRGRSQNPVKRVGHARARVHQVRFFGHSYNSRKREQSRKSGGKTVKLRKTQLHLSIVSGCLCLIRFSGRDARKRRSAEFARIATSLHAAFLWTGRHGARERALLASTPRRLTARACRSSKFGAQRKTPQLPLLWTRVKRGFPRVERRSPSGSSSRAFQKERGKPALQREIRFSVVPDLPGPEKTRLSPRAGSSREESWGCSWGSGWVWGSDNRFPRTK